MLRVGGYAVIYDFEKTLEIGRVGENDVSKYLISNGWTIFPICDSPADNFKGPRLNNSKHDIVAPDILAFTNNQSVWLEVKTKNAATLYRSKNKYGKYRQWQTGIDMNAYEHYCEVSKNTPLPVWLTFLHRDGIDKFSGLQSPTGLYAETLEFLKRNIDHIDTRNTSYGRGGMVYWNICDLKLISSLRDVLDKKQNSFSLLEAKNVI